MEKSGHTVSQRLNAIADALETASKQARLLAEEIEAPISITFSAEEIGRAIHDSCLKDREPLKTSNGT